MSTSMKERYEASSLKEKDANNQKVDAFANDFAEGFTPKRGQGDNSELNPDAIQARTADTSTKYTDITRT